jgi:hypothetical protein
MTSQAIEDTEKKSDDHGRDFVEVSIDGAPKRIHRGSYALPDLKQALGVDASLDLDVIEKDGAFHTIGDNERTTVKEGEKFISHVKKGGSS